MKKWIFALVYHRRNGMETYIRVFESAGLLSLTGRIDARRTMYLLLLVYTWIIGGNAKSFTLKYAWSMGYDAECIVPITENVYGWTLHLKFDQPIYYVESFSGKLVYHTDTEWVLENRPEFAYLTPGQDTKIQFLVRHRDILQPILGSCTFKTHGWNVPLWLPSNELSDRWSSGDTVTKSIHIHTDTAINNWVVCLLFDYPVDYVTVPGGEVLAHLEREWIIRNNDVVYPGQGMDKDLVIHPSGNFPVSGKYFLEKDGCPSIGENPPARLPGPKNQWNGGYETWINIEFQQPVIKWRIRFTFDKRINEVWTDKATLVHNFHDQFEWIIESKPEVSHLNPGQKLPLQVIVKYYGTDVIGALYTVIPVTEETSITMKYDYTRALELSTLFYSAQRSGRLPANNHDISWRSDSAIQDGDRNHDLSGGWYNDGGHVKANLPMAFSTWVLEWGMLKFHEGYKSTGHVNNGCDMIRWSLEYLLKSWVPERNVLYVQVGDKARDNAYWMSPEVMTLERPAFSVNASCPGSDVAANMVSAFAAGKLLFNGLCNDNVFGDTLIQAADSLYRFAKNYRGVYSNCFKQGPHYYRSKDDRDDLSVAAMWMYRATTRINYLQDSKTFLTLDKPDVFSWDDTNIAAALLLYEATHDYTYRTYITTYMMRYFSRSSIHYTTCGLAWSAKPGSNGIAANAAFIATMAAELGLDHQKYTQFAMSQIHYLLGENKLQQSYLIAYGNKYPRNPHHRGSSCSRHKASCSYMEPGPNVNILYGALVSGPDIHDNYTDRRTNYKQNSVALEYNAGFQSTMAGLLTFHHRSTLPISPIPKC